MTVQKILDDIYLHVMPIEVVFISSAALCSALIKEKLLLLFHKCHLLLESDSFSPSAVVFLFYVA